MNLRAQAAQELLARRTARKSLLAFTEYTHPNFERGEHHEQICAALERVEQGLTRYLVLEAPPRHSKSELTSVRLPAWWLGRNPDSQIIAVSYNGDTATEFGYQVRNLVASPEYSRVFPDVALAPDAKAKGRWRTNKNGIYVSAGVGGAITGKGAHLAVVDDPIKSREEADSPTYRERVWKFYHSDLRTRLMPGGAIIVMMTRWHEDDLIGRLLERMPERWERVTLPAIANEGTDDEEALWPGWYPLEELTELRSDYLTSGQARVWYSMYQQDPKPDEGDYIRREWFTERWDDSDGKPDRPVRIYMASDFAVTEPDDGADPDWTVHGVFGVDPDDNLLVLDLWRGKTTPDVWIDALLDLFAKWKPIGYVGESGVIRRSIESSLKKRMRERKVYGPVTKSSWIASTKDKWTRGQAFRTRAALGKVIFPSTAEWSSVAIEECVGFPAATHDDIFDVLSLMCLAIDRATAATNPKPPERKRATDGWKKAKKGTGSKWMTA